MARSDDNQHYHKSPQMDFGIVTLSAAGIGSVVTPLSTVRSGVASHRSGALVASSLQVSALSSGTVTITDSAGILNAGAVVNYILVGLP